MKSRMDRYSNDEVVTNNRSSKNNFLYEELYKDKPLIRSNVTVIDNVKEIDINKIKEMVNNRETYRKQKSYENIINTDISKDEIINYDFEEINDSDYDINEIIAKKRTDRTHENDNKLRKLNGKEYEELKELVIKDKEIINKIDDESLTREEKLAEIINTMVQNQDITDFFANLKQNPEKDIASKKEKMEDTSYTKTNKIEDTFYTKDNKIEKKDFEEDDNRGEFAILIIIVLVCLLIAAGAFIWLKLL